MTNASIKNTFSVLAVFTVATALSLGAFAIVAHAQEDLGYYDSYGDNLGSWETYGDNLGYYDSYGDNLGYTDSYGDNLGYYDSYGDNLGYYDSYGDNLGYYDSYGDNLGYYDSTGGDVYGTDVYGTDVIEEYGVGYSYHEYTPSYSSPSYSTPSYSASQPFSFRAPSTSYAPSYPAPAPQRPVQQQQQQQQQGGGQPINIVNTNNNVNTNTNTNVNTAPVIPVYQTPVTYPVQYVYPQPTYPTYPTQNAYCTITASPSSVMNGQAAYLSWSSNGATSAWLSDGIGAVAVNGSLAVRPNSSKTYTLTVTGYGGTNTCTAYVTVQGSYISLSQIPYTGFDAGILGNALYWLSLISFAVAGAYIMVYYLPTLKLWPAGKGGAFTFATGTVSQTNLLPVTAAVAPEAPIETMTPSPIDAMENLPAYAEASAGRPVAPMARSTMDSMVVMHSKEGDAPRIVITRS